MLPRLFIACLFTAFSLKAYSDGLPSIQTVFIILMENNDWSSIKGNPSAPYINNTLLPMASYCEQYHSPPGLHPSEPNYIWLEAGTNFGVADDNDPAFNHQNDTNHLATLLNNANVTWKNYQEDISGTTVPLTTGGGYYTKHNPFVFFDDVTGTNNPNYAYGIAHIRPYPELVTDLASNTVARYNFLTPNQCHDMHDSCAPVNDAIKQGDDWLATEIPKITNSTAYQNGGAIFITWDEDEGSGGPIGMIVLSPLARGGGYFNNIFYTHSSTLRTMQELFGVTPFLRDATNATDLSDLFSKYKVTNVAKLPGNQVQLTVSGVIPGKTNLVQMSTNLLGWNTVSTNIVATNNFTVTNLPGNATRSFYRVVQIP